MLFTSKRTSESTTTCLPYSFHKSISLNQLSTYYTSLKKISIQKKKINFNKDDFQVIKPLMKGQYGQVYIVKSLIDQQIYAMKVQNKQYLKQYNDKVFIEHEKAIYQQQQQEKEQESMIPDYYCTFEDDKDIYIVMEYMSGGDLFSLLERQPNFILKENQAKFYFAELVECIHYLHHQLGYLHRDIKPQNILFNHLGHIKLSDFGSSIPFHSKLSSSSSNVPVGTCDYISPEILLTFQNDSSSLSYGVEVDWWSAGIVLYEMLQEIPPFYSELGEFDTYKKILFHKDSVSFNSNIPISNDAKDLINKLLDKKENRLTYNEIKAHPFFNGIDWDHLYQSIPPFQPKLANPDDTSYFSI